MILILIPLLHFLSFASITEVTAKCQDIGAITLRYMREMYSRPVDNMKIKSIGAELQLTLAQLIEDVNVCTHVHVTCIVTIRVLFNYFIVLGSETREEDGS